ncbi:MAG: protein-L-isoaspartate(D-aspartate) O-methyltransferase [Acidimicrobiales bacterium]
MDTVDSEGRDASEQADAEVEHAAARAEMVRREVIGKGVTHPCVVAAMGATPRHRFVPVERQDAAYGGAPLQIGEGQTISAPYVVALMIEAARPTPLDRALEVGAGSGYAAAVLARCVAEVYAVERLAPLAEAARRNLAATGVANVFVRCGDGTVGWPDRAPFDIIHVSAGGPSLPRPLLGELAVGGRLVMPVGRTPRTQRLVRVVRTEGGFEEDDLCGVQFVPLIGAAGWSSREL